MTHAPQQEVVDHALGVLAAFLSDYTDPDDDGHRARIVVVGGSVAKGYFDVEVLRAVRSEDATGDERNGVPQRFRVSLVITPAPHPVSQTLIAERDESSGRGGMSSRDEPGVVCPVPGAGHRP